MAFTITTVATVAVDAFATGLGTQRKIGIDSTGRYWCTYIRQVAGLDQIFVAYSDDLGTTWTEEQVALATANQQAGSLAIDSADVLHLFWNGRGWGTFPARQQYVYSQRTGAGWQPIELVTDINVNQTWYGSMAIDGLDNAHVVWGGDGWGVNVGFRNIQYRQRAAGGGWGVQEGVTDIAADQFSPAIAIDLTNNVHVSWDGRGWGVNVGLRNIQYRRRAAGVWGVQEAITDIAHEEVSASIAIDSLNNVHLVWHGWPVGGAAEQVQYRRRTGVGWDAIELVTNVAAPTEQIECTIALTPDNTPYVVWDGESWSTDPTWNNIVYSRRVSGVWETPVLITDRVTMDQVLPNIAWAMWPLVGGTRLNILTDPVFIFTGFIAAEQVEFVRIFFPVTPTLPPSVATLPATGVT